MIKEEMMKGHCITKAELYCPYCGYYQTMKVDGVRFAINFKKPIHCIHCGKEFLIEKEND